MKYNWQQEDWTEFSYDLKGVEVALFTYAELVGRISGMAQALPDDAQTDFIISTMVAEAVKTSEIEGEYISRKDVMSSIRNNLGLNRKPEKVKDKRVSGISELMLDVRDSFKEQLTEAKLFAWHKMLMKGNRHVAAGKWRSHKEPMQVVSGAAGKERVHFEAPPSGRIAKEMKAFIRWFNDTAPNGKSPIRQAPVRSAIAHLYFETLHPFEDGNGRIGRAISEKALSQNAGRPVLLSLSQTIEANKKSYYNALEKAQMSNEITKWIEYFVSMTLEAQNEAEQQIEFVLKKARFFDKFKDQLNERQMKVVRRMLEQGAQGFEGGMNARKYVSIAKTSKATATRDLQDLADKSVLVVSGGGRSTGYCVNI